MLYSSLKADSSNTSIKHYVLSMEPSAFCTFGFLLDSVEGLATHSRVLGSDKLDIFVSPEQEEDFHRFLNIWREYQLNNNAKGLFELQEQHDNIEGASRENV